MADINCAPNTIILVLLVLLVEEQLLGRFSENLPRVAEERGWIVLEEGSLGVYNDGKSKVLQPVQPELVPESLLVRGVLLLQSHY